MQTEGQCQDDTGVLHTGLCREDIDHRQSKHIKTVLKSAQEFDIVASLHDIMHRVMNHHHEKIEEKKKDRQIPVQHRRVRHRSQSDQHRQDKRDLKTKLIDEHKVQMFRPPLGITLIHGPPPEPCIQSTYSVFRNYTLPLPKCPSHTTSIYYNLFSEETH